jgi:hypothetical protein
VGQYWGYAARPPMRVINSFAVSFNRVDTSVKRSRFFIWWRYDHERSIAVHQYMTCIREKNCH